MNSQAVLSNTLSNIGVLILMILVFNLVQVALKMLRARLEAREDEEPARTATREYFRSLEGKEDAKSLRSLLVLIGTAFIAALLFS